MMFNKYGLSIQMLMHKYVILWLNWTSE